VFAYCAQINDSNNKCQYN